MSASASGPPSESRPMWLMSKRPAALRTVECSSMIVVYCTGMSQPAKSTMRAPCAACQSCKTVRWPIRCFSEGGAIMRLCDRAANLAKFEMNGHGGPNFLVAFRTDVKKNNTVRESSASAGRVLRTKSLPLPDLFAKVHRGAAAVAHPGLVALDRADVAPVVNLVQLPLDKAVNVGGLQELRVRNHPRRQA